VYRASDERENAEWLETLETAADRLGLGTDARTHARDVFLSTVPEADRSKQAKLASSLYVGALIAGDQRAQTKVADAVGVSRLSVQQHWKDQLAETGLEPPGW
jgi:transcription initiation factor TFIIIB Brf1 subunit/transcription initiation factor TFIIB